MLELTGAILNKMSATCRGIKLVKTIENLRKFSGLLFVIQIVLCPVTRSILKAQFNQTYFINIKL